MFGLQIGERGADGTVHLRMDDRHRRLSIHPGQKERLAYVGWELSGKVASPRPSPSWTTLGGRD